MQQYYINHDNDSDIYKIDMECDIHLIEYDRETDSYSTPNNYTNDDFSFIIHVPRDYNYVVKTFDKYVFYKNEVPNARCDIKWKEHCYSNLYFVYKNNIFQQINSNYDEFVTFSNRESYWEMHYCFENKDKLVWLNENRLNTRYFIMRNIVDFYVFIYDNIYIRISKEYDIRENETLIYSFVIGGKIATRDD